MKYQDEIGLGFYSAADAARLLHLPVRSVRRWMGGYEYKEKGQTFFVEPLWMPQIEAEDDHIEISFRDLIELRFVAAFTKAGLGLKTIRNCIEYARICVEDERPFSTRKFHTDGRTIFLESVSEMGDAQTLDLKKSQYVIHKAIERTFKDLDIEDDLVTRWRPYKGKDSIVIDPQRSFGQPIVSDKSVPTVTLWQAFQSEGSLKKVSFYYEVPIDRVRDAVRYEESLAA